MVLRLFFLILIVGVSSNHASVDQREFPRTTQCQCNSNEHFVKSSQICQLTCTNQYVIGESSTCEPFTGCVCNRGYVRLNDDGTGPCVYPDACPEHIWCGPHEVQTDCVIECPPQTCERLYKTFKCENKTIGRKGCNCIDGYLRNSLGMCIPSSFCPTPPPSSYYPKFDYDSSPHPHFRPSTQNTTTVALCSANKQSLASSTSTIVTSTFSASSANHNIAYTFSNSTFSVSKTCLGINEVWHPCPSVCLLENCDDVDCPPVACTKEQICEPRCICKENHYRNASNDCIHMDFCPYYIYLVHNK